MIGQASDPESGREGWSLPRQTQPPALETIGQGQTSGECGTKVYGDSNRGHRQHKKNVLMLKVLWLRR